MCRLLAERLLVKNLTLYQVRAPPNQMRFAAIPVQFVAQKHLILPEPPGSNAIRHDPITLCSAKAFDSARTRTSASGLAARYAVRSVLR